LAQKNNTIILKNHYKFNVIGSGEKKKTGTAGRLEVDWAEYKMVWIPAKVFLPDFFFSMPYLYGSKIIWADYPSYCILKRLLFLAPRI